MAKFNEAAEKSEKVRHQLVVVTLLLTLASAWLTEAIGIYYF